MVSALGQCFNPSVGILFIQAEQPQHQARASQRGFNPSVGILFIQALIWSIVSSIPSGFNPSVGILFIQAFSSAGEGIVHLRVSIPRSGFCSFKPRELDKLKAVVGVSIPRSGFCSFKLEY